MICSGEWPPPVNDAFGSAGVEAVFKIEAAIMVGFERAGIEIDILALKIFGRRHIERHIEVSQQESGGADMIRMQMRGDDPRQRALAQHAVEKRLPSEPRRLITETGIDQRPAVAIVDEIDVHVIEPERQSKPRPQNTGRDFDGAGGRGRQAVRIDQLRAGGGLGNRFLHRQGDRPRSDNCQYSRGSPSRARTRSHISTAGFARDKCRPHQILRLLAATQGNIGSIKMQSPRTIADVATNFK
jgi:hypothetical protein